MDVDIAFDWANALVAACVGLVLGMGGYFIVSFIAGTTVLWAWPAAWIVFGFLIYRDAVGPRDVLANGLFYAGILLFILPVSLLIFGFKVTSGGPEAGQAGGIFGGVLLAAIGVVICWPLGIAFYLGSNRLGSDTDSTE